MGEPLVFLPGMMCDARLFGPQLAELSPKFTITVAPITKGQRIEEIASSLLDTLPRKFALAGHSLGGSWRWSCCAAHPTGSPGLH